jgi:hypothetical protein
MSYRLDGRGSTPDSDKRFCSLLSTVSRPALGSYPVDTGGSFIWGKVARLEAGHSLPFSTEVKNGGAIPPLPIRPHGAILN